MQNLLAERTINGIVQTVRNAVLQDLALNDRHIDALLKIGNVHKKVKDVQVNFRHPLRGTHCLSDSDIEFAFTGGRWM